MSSGTGWRMISWKNFSLSSILLSHWVIENIGFTRRGQEYLTKLARDIIADNDRLYASQQSDPGPCLAGESFVEQAKDRRGQQNNERPNHAPDHPL